MLDNNENNKHEGCTKKSLTYWPGQGQEQRKTKLAGQSEIISRQFGRPKKRPAIHLNRIIIIITVIIKIFFCSQHEFNITAQVN